MGIAAYLRHIGRGKDGARPLDTLQAHDLMSQVLDRQASDLEVGAFALAMRIKGETPEELLGFVQAAHERCIRLPMPDRPVVLLPSYNGARKLPNLTPLLAGHLAQQGLAVLVHGTSNDPSRVTTAQVWQALGWPLARTPDQVLDCWSQGQAAFMAIEYLCPQLADLLNIRWTIGLRNSGHTVAKLLSPWQPDQCTVQVVNHTHPEYAHSLTAYLAQAQSTAILMRGTEGEPVADPRRQPKWDAFVRGERSAEFSQDAQTGSLTHLPGLPDSREAPVTAHYIADVLQGASEMPHSIAKQGACLARMAEKR